MSRRAAAVPTAGAALTGGRTTATTAATGAAATGAAVAVSCAWRGEQHVPTR